MVDFTNVSAPFNTVNGMLEESTGMDVKFIRRYIMCMMVVLAPEIHKRTESDGNIMASSDAGNDIGHGFDDDIYCSCMALVSIQPRECCSWSVMRTNIILTYQRWYELDSIRQPSWR